MRVADFRFDLPERLIAGQPAEPRDAARLFVYERASGACHHVCIRDLPSFLVAGDLLVGNDTKVLPHRLLGRRPSGGRVEVLILERLDAEGRCRGYVKPARKARVGERWVLEQRIAFEPEVSLGEGMFVFKLADLAGESLDAAIEAVGRAPLPPYIPGRDEGADVHTQRERYQTVFARHAGAVAAPTAGLHFTTDLLATLAAGGVEMSWVTLHVGEGTFAPLRVDEVEAHRMHAERYVLPQSTAEAVRRTRQRGGRVVAIGTTALRTLETCALDDGLVRAGAGSTELFLYPGRELCVVDALLTNFHLPESTLLMLVSAIVGRERLLELYAEAVRREYRFFSFGDAMLLLP